MEEIEKRPEADASDVENKEPEAEGVCVESETNGQDRSFNLNEALDSLEAALERPLIPAWNKFKELSRVKRLLVSFALSLIAAGLAFSCFLPGIIRTVERNRAEAEAIARALADEEAERLAAELAKALEPSERELAEKRIAEHKHELLSKFFSSEYRLQMRTCGLILSNSQLSKLYTLEETATGYHFIPDREAIRSFIAECCESNEPDPVAVKYFKVAKTRDTVYYPGKDEGFSPDMDSAVSELALLIALGEGGTVEMKYFGSSYCESLYQKIKGTGMEISIDNQYLWLYCEGKPVVETPIVTGNVQNGDSTPEGRFMIYWITTDTYLKGATWNDYVSHWAPFYGNYGIHDAQWRDEFGGDIYLTDGSHGCVNVPIEAMNKIAEYYYVGMPLVIY